MTLGLGCRDCSSGSGFMTHGLGFLVVRTSRFGLGDLGFRVWGLTRRFRGSALKV